MKMVKEIVIRFLYVGQNMARVSLTKSQSQNLMGFFFRMISMEDSSEIFYFVYCPCMKIFPLKLHIWLYLKWHIL